ncbi:MAG: phospholipase D-like domain-containing protein, partial [Anaerolineae bacterium]
RAIGLRGAWRFEVMTAPENALAPGAGLFGLLARAGPGDEVLVAELDEPPWWGRGSPAGQYPNPRVAAYLSAARRGATVRVLLDSFFDDPAGAGANRRTVAALNHAAAAEGLDLAARLGNPSGLGLHAKVVLVRLGGVAGEAWTHIGSLNGTEAASKGNREVALQVSSPGTHAFLAGVFARDWEEAGFDTADLPWLAR